MKNLMQERVIIIAIAINQLLLSIVMLGVAYIFGSFILVLGLWGVVNACVLLFFGIGPRIGAFLWHLVFVGYVLIGFVLGLPDNQSYRFIELWAIVAVAAAWYLARTVLNYFRKQKAEI